MMETSREERARRLAVALPFPAAEVDELLYACPFLTDEQVWDCLMGEIATAGLVSRYRAAELFAQLPTQSTAQPPVSNAKGGADPEN
jgi:hypothetical protein